MSSNLQEAMQNVLAALDEMRADRQGRTLLAQANKRRFLDALDRFADAIGEVKVGEGRGRERRAG